MTLSLLGIQLCLSSHWSHWRPSEHVCIGGLNCLEEGAVWALKRCTQTFPSPGPASSESLRSLNRESIYAWWGLLNLTHSHQRKPQAGPAHLLPQDPGLEWQLPWTLYQWSASLSPYLCKRFYFHVRTVPRSGQCLITALASASGSKAKAHRSPFTESPFLASSAPAQLLPHDALGSEGRGCPAESVDKAGHSYLCSFIHPPSRHMDRARESRPKT